MKRTVRRKPRRRLAHLVVPIQAGRGIGRTNIGYSWKGVQVGIGISPHLRGLSRWKTVLHEGLHLLDFRLKESTVLTLEDRLTDLILSNRVLIENLWQAAEKLQPAGVAGTRVGSRRVRSNPGTRSRGRTLKN